MVYEYRILSQGVSKWDNLEGFASKLEQLLNGSQVAALQRDGWELWQTNTLSDDQGDNGFLFVFRRPTTAPA